MAVGGGEDTEPPSHFKTLPLQIQALNRQIVWLRLKPDVRSLKSAGNFPWILKKGVLCFHSNSSSFPELSDALLVLHNLLCEEGVKSTVEKSTEFKDYEITATEWGLGRERANAAAFGHVQFCSLGV